METLEEKSNDFEGLIKLEERDNTIISIINRISPKLQKKIYDAIKVKINYAEITWETQKRWTEVHEYLLGIDLARQNQDSSHLAIKKEETKEIIEGRGQNIRFRLYYAATYRH
ncbi:MAG TPA: hypothetical protein VMC07_02755, partial [Candidatus Omnitrophota bacterium]|nr:hypothetical protein [Candidatus Omnitrophota bacterium]